MLQYATRRILGMIPLLLLVILTIFLLIRSVPGDPARNLLGDKATPQEIERVTEELGLNEPLYVQFGIYFGNLLRGDMGRSYIKDQAISDEIGERFPATFELATTAMIFATIFGLLAGILSAVFRGRWLDYLSMVLALIGVSVPVFWLGIILIMVFGGNHPFPSAGRVDWGAHFSYSPGSEFYILDSLIHGDFAMTWELLRHLFLPAVALATIPMAVISRMTRSSLLETLHQDYVRTARAKGVGERKVILKHALRPALISVITVLGLQFGVLLAGAVLTETVFTWPGLGTFIVDAVNERDYNAVQGGVLVIAVGFMFCNLLADLSYAWADPRVKL